MKKCIIMSDTHGSQKGIEKLKALFESWNEEQQEEFLNIAYLYWNIIYDKEYYL